MKYAKMPEEPEQPIPSPTAPEPAAEEPVHQETSEESSSESNDSEAERADKLSQLQQQVEQLTVQTEFTFINIIILSFYNVIFPLS